MLDNLVEYKLLSFMEAYSSYNQIPMYESHKEKTTLMIEQANYQYIMIPSGLKNVGETYHRMMNKVFKEKIGGTLEVYMNDMIFIYKEDI